MAGVSKALNRGGERTSGIPAVHRSGMLVLCAAACALMTTLLATPVAAQDSDCARLEGAIRAAESEAGPSDTGGFARAAQQQRYEIDRTRRYSAQIGCDQQASGPFSDGPPPECDDLQDRLGRMQDNLEKMEARAAGGEPADTPSRHAALVARYNATCAGVAGNPASLGQDGGSGFLPEDGRNPAAEPPGGPDDLSMVPLNGSIMEGGSDQNRVAGRTICVRTCDGGYFPLAPQASTDQIGGLEQLCKAACPNTEAKLYTMRGGELGSAVATDGSTYMDLPAAFKFEKSYTASCTCKPPNQSWADALAGAEQLLEKGDRRDVTVTSALSDQMAKPLATPVPTGRKAGRRAAALVPTVQSDQKVAADGARAAQAPTASNESAGIGGPAKSERLLGKSDGLKITTEGPDGVTKRIRLIVP